LRSGILLGVRCYLVGFDTFRCTALTVTNILQCNCDNLKLCLAVFIRLFGWVYKFAFTTQIISSCTQFLSCQMSPFKTCFVHIRNINALLVIHAKYNIIIMYTQ